MRRGVAAAAVGTLVALAAWPQSASAAAEPGVVNVSTLPAVAGVSVSVAGASGTTGASGTVSLVVADLSNVASSARLTSGRAGRHTVTLAHVVNNSVHPDRVRRLVLGLRVSSLVTVSIRSGSTTTSPSEVNRLRLHSSRGDVLLIDPRTQRSVALRSRDVALAHGVLRADAVTWNVDSVQTNSGATVKALRQPFDPFASSTWRIELVPIPGNLIVTTVPAVPGVRLSLDKGPAFTTDASGVAHTTVTDLNDPGSRLKVVGSDEGSTRLQVVTLSSAKPAAPFQRHVILGLSVRRAVQVRLVDLHGAAVSPTRADRIVLVNSLAQTTTVTGAELAKPVWLLAAVPTRVAGTVTAKSLTYSVTSVRLDGGEGVFAAQQRFNPNVVQKWPVRLQLFDMTFRVQDTLLHSGSGRQLIITGPDSRRVVRVRLDGNHSVRVRSMVRGTYTVQVTPSGLSARTPVLVSRDDAVELRIVSRVDVAIGVIVAETLAATLLLVGRIRRRRRQAPREAS